MLEKTLAQQSNALVKKEISSVELTQCYLDRIKQLDKQLNSFITVTEQTALAQAKEADQSLAKGCYTPLMGIPMAYKDLLCTQGVRTTCASKMLDNFVSPYESTVTQKLKNSGVVMLGKTNMDEFAMGSTSESSYYGPVVNPWDDQAIPGGSSGGSAVCVAARMASASLGSDTGGSIRQPASHCGITGLKPTYGRVSRFGMVAYASSLDQIGPMARSAEDVATILSIISGFDPMDSTSANIDVPNYIDQLEQSIRGKVIAIPKEFIEGISNSEMIKLIEAAINMFKQLGAKLIDVSLPTLDLAIAAYYVIATAEASSNLSRFDGVRYGYRSSSAQSIEDLYNKTRSEGFGEEVKKRILVGTYALSAGYFDAFYLQAMKIRRLVSDDFKRVFKACDAILGINAPTPAFDLNQGHNAEDILKIYLSDQYTVPINLAGLPAISIPVGQVKKRPVGLQLIGKHYDEATLLNLAHQFQKVTDFHLLCPLLPIDQTGE